MGFLGVLDRLQVENFADEFDKKLARFSERATDSQKRMEGNQVGLKICRKVI